MFFDRSTEISRHQKVLKAKKFKKWAVLKFWGILTRVENFSIRKNLEIFFFANSTYDFLDNFESSASLDAFFRLPFSTTLFYSKSYFIIAIDLREFSNFFTFLR